MKKISCIVEFADTRIKPRTVKVEAGSRKEARRAARAEIAAKHPAWEIAQVTTAVLGTVKPAAERNVDGTKVLTPEQVDKRLAAGMAALIAPRGSKAWWTEYRTIRATQKLGAAQQVPATV